MTVPIENTSVDTSLDISELTQGCLEGKGVFDVLLQTLRLHLDREFASGRITGTAYATVYSQALTTFLQQSIGYCISKTKLALELTQMQEQIELTQLQQAQTAAQTRQIDYITDTQLPADVALKNKQLDLLAYDLTFIKPQELALSIQELALKSKQVDLIEFDLTTIKPQELALLAQQVALQTFIVTTRMPAEVSQIEAETDKLFYETNTVMPEQVKLTKLNQDQLIAQTNKISTDTVVTIKQGNLTDAQTCEVKARTNQVNAEVALKLPEEVEMIKRSQIQTTAQTELLAYDLNNIKPVELSNLTFTGQGITAQTALLDYDLNSTKPVELSNLTKTGLSITAQTDNLVSENSNIVKQGIVLDKQALAATAETAQVTYRTSNTLPAELVVIQKNQDQLTAQTMKVAVDTVVSAKQGNLTDAQTCDVKAKTNQTNAEVALKLPEEVAVLLANQAQVAAQTDEVIYRVNTLLPSQTAQVEAQTDQVVYTTTYMLPKQVLNTEAQTGQVTYTTSSVLPSQVAQNVAQKENLEQQTVLYNQKTVTELAQATSTAATDSVLGIQNALMVQQTKNFVRDSEQKAAKIMIDTWNVRYNNDPTFAPFNVDNKLRETDIGIAVDALLTGLSK